MKYLFKFIFLFLRSGVEAKCGVEFHQSTRKAPRIRRKAGNGIFLNDNEGGGLFGLSFFVMFFTTEFWTG